MSHVVTNVRIPRSRAIHFIVESLSLETITTGSCESPLTTAGKANVASSLRFWLLLLFSSRSIDVLPLLRTKEYCNDKIEDFCVSLLPR